jgi:hypothetical protein
MCNNRLSSVQSMSAKVSAGYRYSVKASNKSISTEYLNLARQTVPTHLTSQ